MADRIETIVRDKYAATAASGLSSDHDGVRAVAEAFGYSADELSSIPAEANMGLSCGNPTAFASLRTGEVVVDLGCGGGLDVFLAAQKVGPTGKAIGIDMTPQMIELAKRNAGRGNPPPRNVEFHLATIDKLPLPDASADVVISNCVINLAPDKPAVFREIARVLKPGGRVLVTDLVAHGRESYRQQLGHQWLGFAESQIVEWLQNAGFGRVHVHTLPASPDTKGPGLFVATGQKHGHLTIAD